MVLMLLNGVKQFSLLVIDYCFFLLLLLMYHIATHNIGLGSHNDDFKHLMKDLLMMDHFVKGIKKQL